MSAGSIFTCAAVLSTHSRLETAVEDVCRRGLEQLGTVPHLAVLFVSAMYPEINNRLAARVCQLLGTDLLLGGTAESLVTTGRELEGEPGVSLWLARMDGVRLVPMHLCLERTPEGASIVGWPDELAEDWPSDATMLIVGDPFSFPADLMLERLNEDRPDLRVVGGMASGGARAGRHPAPSRLAGPPRRGGGGDAQRTRAGHDDRFARVPARRSPPDRHQGRSQCDSSTGGRSALLRLKEIFDTLPATEQRMVQTGLHLERAVNEYQDQFEQGDFLVAQCDGDRSRHGLDRGRGLPASPARPCSSTCATRRPPMRRCRSCSRRSATTTPVCRAGAPVHLQRPRHSAIPAAPP